MGTDVNGVWFCYKCDPNCGETGWFVMPLNVNFGGPSSPVLRGFCPMRHQTTIRGEDVQKVWPSPEQKTPEWFPIKPR
jgi:hypothetical protein